MFTRALLIALPLMCGVTHVVGVSAVQAQGCRATLEQDLVEQFQSALSAKNEQAKPIYGCDDRKNYFDPLATANQRLAAQATAVMVKRDQLKSDDNGKHWNLSPPAGTKKLCSPQQVVDAGGTTPERFWSEPYPGLCSGFKVGKRLIATAGHCVKSEADCAQRTFVFGFHMTSSDAKPDQGISQDRLYRCSKIIAGAYSESSDWRIVEVDRDIDAPQVSVRTATTSPALGEGTGLTVVGYPMGLPVKIADGAVVREIRSTTYFRANLDTYEGNSGSVVFNTEKLANGELLAEGILVRGENDYARENPCRISKHCSGSGCRGEDVTLASEFAHILDKQ